MVASLDQQVTKVTQVDLARSRMLVDQMQRLQEGISSFKAAREILEGRRVKDCRLLESNILHDLEKAAQDRAAMEEKLEDSCRSSFDQLQSELRRDSKRSTETLEQYSQELSEEVKRLSVILEFQRSARLEHGERTVSSLEDEFQKLHEAIVAEQQLRFDAEGTMIRMVEEMRNQMQNEIMQERAQREAVQGKLLCLLEETCHRIEAPLLSSRTPAKQSIPLISPNHGPNRWAMS